MDVVRDLTENPEVLWTFFTTKPQLSQEMMNKLGPGIDRGRMTLYAGIDCNTFFPRLYERWVATQPLNPLRSVGQSNPVHVPAAISAEVRHQTGGPTIVEGDDEDRPPLIEICVGRDAELQTLEESKARVVFLTGMGGQGKSTIAARYFSVCQSNQSFLVYVWRDCKEERERFENQLSSVIETLSGGKVSGDDLARQSTASMIEVLLPLIKDRKVLFTFDNVDHYIDLELGTMSGGPDLFVKALLEAKLESRAVFTCRPEVRYDHPLALSIRLDGLSVEAAAQLFSQRGAAPSPGEIEKAHNLTKGHAFWLDLLAVQVVKNSPSISLHALVAQIDTGTGFLPEKTLRSIWKTLKPREHTVLRAMAERYGRRRK